MIPLFAMSDCVFCMNSTSLGSSLAMAAAFDDFQFNRRGADPLHTKWNRARMLLAV